MEKNPSKPAPKGADRRRIVVCEVRQVLSRTGYVTLDCDNLKPGDLDRLANYIAAHGTHVGAFANE